MPLPEALYLPLADIVRFVVAPPKTLVPAFRIPLLTTILLAAAAEAVTTSVALVLSIVITPALVTALPNTCGVVAPT